MPLVHILFINSSGNNDLSTLDTITRGDIESDSTYLTFSGSNVFRWYKWGHVVCFYGWGSIKASAIEVKTETIIATGLPTSQSRGLACKILNEGGTVSSSSIHLWVSSNNLVCYETTDVTNDFNGYLAGIYLSSE